MDFTQMTVDDLAGHCEDTWDAIEEGTGVQEKVKIEHDSLLSRTEHDQARHDKMEVQVAPEAVELNKYTMWQTEAVRRQAVAAVEALRGEYGEIHSSMQQPMHGIAA